MTAQYETTLHRWFEEVWNQGREDVMEEMFPPEGIAHGLGEAPVRGAAEYLPFYRAFKESLPDINVTIEEYIEDGERIAAHCRVRAVHSGKGLGFGPTNQALDFEFMAFATIRDGKIMEARNILDFEKMYKQMGVFALRNVDNEMMFRAWFDEVWNRKNAAAIDEMLDADAVHHGLGPDPVCGIEEFKGFFKSFSSTFPDITVEIHEVFSIGERLAARYTAHATHTGDGLGVEPTNKKISFSGGGTCIIRDGKFIEVWNQIDFLSIYQQLGLVKLGS